MSDNAESLKYAIKNGLHKMLINELSTIHKKIDMSAFYIMCLEHRRVKCTEILRDHGCQFRNGNVFLKAIEFDSVDMVDSLPISCIKQIKNPFAMCAGSTDLISQLLKMKLKPTLNEIPRVLSYGNINTISLVLLSMTKEDIEKARNYYDQTNIMVLNKESLLCDYTESNPVKFDEIMEICLGKPKPEKKSK